MNMDDIFDIFLKIWVCYLFLYGFLTMAFIVRLERECPKEYSKLHKPGLFPNFMSWPVVHQFIRKGGYKSVSSSFVQRVGRVLHLMMYLGYFMVASALVFTVLAVQQRAAA